ncbi:hypothetical protein [Rhodococcus daqingensis]|uniref:Uncharacterized protein n=1 Tax=Rhodococcus daqingensis TaxID=2479363 RepID=A0ABW2S3K6_9NOCA
MRKITYANMRDSSLNDTTASLPDEEAARLVQSGQARYTTAEATAPQTTTTATAELTPTPDGTAEAAEPTADEAPASGRGRGSRS